MIDGSHEPKTIWQRVKFPLVIVAIFAFWTGTYLLADVITDRLARNVRVERAAKAVKDDHIKQCRLQLGLDYKEVTDAYRRYMMACAASVVDREVAKGASGTVAADRAWKTCMPDMTSCDAGLR